MPNLTNKLSNSSFMKKQLHFFVLFFVFISILKPCISFGSHIMGGSLSYAYAGYNAGTNKYIFDITLKVYRYCAPGSSNLPNTLDLGVYDENPALPLANKNRNSQFSMPLIENSFIVPPNANDSCTFCQTYALKKESTNLRSGLVLLQAGITLSLTAAAGMAILGTYSTRAMQGRPIMHLFHLPALQTTPRCLELPQYLLSAPAIP